jgi:hypothetical protein
MYQISRAPHAARHQVRPDGLRERRPRELNSCDDYVETLYWTCLLHVSGYGFSPPLTLVGFLFYVRKVRPRIHTPELSRAAGKFGEMAITVNYPCKDNAYS